MSIIKKSITIDCRLIDSSGVGSYLRGVLPYLIKTDYTIVAFGNTKKIKNYFPDIRIFIIECNINPFSIKDICFFPKKILKIINKTDIYFSPFFNIPYGIKIPVFTTIHDIIFPDFKNISSFIGTFLRMFFYRRAFRKSKKVFTVSEFSKSRIIHHLGNKKNVVVTYESINSNFFEYRKIIKSAKKEKNIVFIGNIKKHKGIDTLIDAFIQAKTEGLDHNLVIIGSMTKLRTTDTRVLKKIKSLNNDSIILTGFISDDKLMELLSKASLLVNPSRYEGFGLPVLEALVLGTNVLISDIPAFKEIYGEFPVSFFKAGDVNDLKEKIIKLTQNYENANPVLNDELLEKYTFEKTVNIILKEFLC